MEEPGLAPALNNDLGLSIRPGAALEEIRSSLAAYINDLINNNFNQLVSLLYRIDVSENKLRQLLGQQAGRDSAQLIADLIIERQLQKIKSRKENRQNKKESDEAESW